MFGVGFGDPNVFGIKWPGVGGRQGLAAAAQYFSHLPPCPGHFVSRD